MNKTIEFVYVDDWCAMYVDGKMRIDGHSLHYTHVLSELGITFQERLLDLPKDFNDWDYFIDFADNIEDIKVERYPDAVDTYNPLVHYDDEVLN